MYIVSQKKHHTIYVCNKSVKCHSILQILGQKNTHREFETKTYTQPITPHDVI